jgi:hypothetical protein
MNGDSLTSPEVAEPYSDWKQIAGFFDGDGTNNFVPRKHVVHPNLGFCDNYYQHITMLREFLIRREVETWALFHDAGGAWKFGVGQADSVHKVATSMLPYLFKKREEVRAMVDYLDNRITADQMVDVFNQSVRIGNRVGKIKNVGIPYTRKEGQALGKEAVSRHSKKLCVKNRILSDEVLEQIRQAIISGTSTNGELAKKYGVSPATITRAVFGRSESG